MKSIYGNVLSKMIEILKIVENVFFILTSNIDTFPSHSVTIACNETLQFMKSQLNLCLMLVIGDL